ncbi:hypothetical protein GCK72_019796 [Caenorhabditis remanei]|uniref:Uncharacterized protein n=1 Tax=Caenorhabditis remanei TaxID=31234 RepID=A0A6A5GDU4_CAERE|nr:hypothetical protein GCK72_019796 [Caenorhabditis remanei]KAF1753240.1 hypothetical protein GCK72_019796 [Caenorhabditis remanei]
MDAPKDLVLNATYELVGLNGKDREMALKNPILMRIIMQLSSEIMKNSKSEVRIRSDGFIGIMEDEEKVLKFCEQIKKESAENVMKLMALKEVIFGNIGPEKKDSETKESASEVKKNSSFYSKAREMEENKEEIMKLKEYEKRLKTVVENSSEVAIIWK